MRVASLPRLTDVRPTAKERRVRELELDARLRALEGK
jgi:hypothetical protein